MSDYYLHERIFRDLELAGRSFAATMQAEISYLVNHKVNKIFRKIKTKSLCWLSAEAIKLELSKFQQNNAQKFSLATLKNLVTLQRYEC